MFIILFIYFHFLWFYLGSYFVAQQGCNLQPSMFAFVYSDLDDKIVFSPSILSMFERTIAIDIKYTIYR